MKTYGELRIKLNDCTPDEFGDRAETAATNGWSRDRSKDLAMRQAGSGSSYTFTLTGHDTLPPAFLFLTDHSSGVLYVSNVISPAHDRLNYDQYNDILKSFCDGVLAHIQPRNSVEIDLSGGTIDLSTQLPAEVYKRLQAFSVGANKKTGSSHPFDRERWMDFLIQAVEARAVLDAHTLTRWLVEEGNWDPEQASRLGEKYEFGRDLLERRRRAS